MAIILIFFSTFLLLVFTVSYAWDGSSREDVKDYANYIAQVEKVPVSMLMGIIKAESDFNPTAKNPVGTASGALQFLDSTFKNYCIDTYHFAQNMSQKNNPFIQINCAVEMLKDKNGWRHWLASFPYWKNDVVT